MSPLDIDLGVDLEVTDDPQPSAAPTATDTMFLIHPLVDAGSPDGLTKIESAGQARESFPLEPSLLAITDAFFNIGGARIYLSSLETTAIAAASAFQPSHGPGQLVVPTVIASADLEPVKDWCWETNRIGIFNGADGASAATLATLSDALIDASSARFSSIEADTILIPGTAPGTTREVRASVIAAALMARSDIATGNPNLAAAGNHTPGAAGQVDYAVGIKGERPATQQQTLAEAQVNCFRTVNNRVRKYGDWTLADLDFLPHWWDLSGSRTTMAIRAREQAVAEEMMFSQVDAQGGFLDRYYGALSGELAALQRLGAIYGTAQSPGYSVNVSAAVNPLSQVKLGVVKADIVFRVSPPAVDLKITITRRAIDAEVA